MNENYPNIAACDPRECFSGRINRCNRIISGVFRKYLKQFDITNSQLSALFMVTKTGGIKQQGLANKLFMDKSTVNRNLKRLLDKGYIEKKEGLIKTTNKGKYHLEQIIPEWNKAMTEMSEMLKKEGIDSINTLTQILTT